MDYKIPPQVTIGHVHLKVTNIPKALEFYRDLLGFEITHIFLHDLIGYNKGTFYVEFENETDVKNAIKKHKRRYQGKKIMGMSLFLSQ